MKVVFLKLEGKKAHQRNDHINAMYDNSNVGPGGATLAANGFSGGRSSDHVEARAIAVRKESHNGKNEEGEEEADQVHPGWLGLFLLHDDDIEPHKANDHRPNEKPKSKEIRQPD